MTLLWLYLLALLDGLLCGGRVCWCGDVGGAGDQHDCAGSLAVVNRLSPNQAELVGDLEDAAERMLWVFVPYAVAVVGSLALRIIPSTDLRSATSVFALGPFTAIRPLVMVAGVLYGIWRSQLLETRVLGLFILGLMLSLEFFLNRVVGARQEREIAEVV